MTIRLIGGIKMSYENNDFNISSINNYFRLFFNYIIFAGIAASIDVVVLYYLTEAIKFWYFYSAAISYSIGMIVNYSLNKYFNFRNGYKKIIPQFGMFAIVALIGLELNQIIIYSIVEFYGLEYIFAKFISLFIVAFWSFYGHKNLTFEIYK